MPFTIDMENNITAFPSSKEIVERADGTETLNNLEELTTLAAQWSGARLVAIWNSLPGVEPVTRFTSRKVAVARMWKAIERLLPTVGAPKRTVATMNPRAGKKATYKAHPVAREDRKLTKSSPCYGSRMASPSSPTLSSFSLF